MGISYAGVTLPVLTPDAYQAIEGRISLQDLCPWGNLPADVGRGGFGLAAKRFHERPPRIGHLTWPSGASRWATGFFLATDEILDEVRTAISPAYAPASLIIDDGGNSITASLYMLMARPLLGPSGNQLWLLVLVDQRYFWWNTLTGPQVELKYYSSTANPYADLLALLPGSPTIAFDTPSLPAPPLLLVPGEAVPPILDWMALCLGQRIVCDLNGSIYAYNVASAQAITASNLTLPNPLIAGGSLALDATSSNDLPALLPQSVRVDFLPSNYGLPPQDGSGSQTVNFSSLGISTGAETNDSTLAFPLPSWTGGNHTTAQAWATAFYQWLTASIDCVLAGAATWVPSGLESWIDWEYNKSSLGVKTRIHRAEYESECYLPSAPQATVKPTTSTSSTIYLPGGSTITGYNAALESWNAETGAWTDNGTAWFVGVNGESPSSGTRYECRLLGADQNDVLIWGTSISGLTLKNDNTVVDAACTTLVIPGGSASPPENPLAIVHLSPGVDELNWNKNGANQTGFVDPTQPCFATIFSTTVPDSAGFKVDVGNGSANWVSPSTVYGGIGLTGLVLLLDTSNHRVVAEAGALSPGGYASASFAVTANNGANIFTGQWGTDPVGNRISGGLITTIGTGVLGTVDGISTVTLVAGSGITIQDNTPSAGKITISATGTGGGMSNPMTTLGDIIYENATPAPARLAGNTTTNTEFLSQTGTGSQSAPPSWRTLAALTSYSGTTTSTFVQLFSLTNSNGIYGVFSCKNTGSSNNMYVQLQTTNAYGTVSSPVNIAVSHGSYVQIDLGTGWYATGSTPNPSNIGPFTSIAISVEDFTPGSHTTYSAELSLLG